MNNDLLSSELAAAVQHYFDVLYKCDLEKFDRVFHPACHVFTVVDGREKVLTLAAYREVISARQSPMSQGHSREEMLVAAFPLSSNIAMVRLRVRLGTVVYRDHIHFVRSCDGWRIAAKLYALDS